MGRPKGSKNGMHSTIEKTCAFCNEQFNVRPSNADAQFCSRICRDTARRGVILRQEQRTCPHCGNTFLIQPHDPKKYCSLTCANTKRGIDIRGPRASTKFVTNQCPVCSIEFTAPASSQKVYCSQACARNDRSRILSKPHRSTQFVTKNCPICSISFTAHVSHRKKYCSKQCGSKSYQRRTQLVCQVCNKTYTVRAKFHNQRYCSRQCCAIGLGKTETSIERTFAVALRNAQIEVVPQFPHGQYSVDFAIPDLKIAIECDGDYWHSLPKSIKHDRMRDNYFYRNGWQTIRFSETEINTNIKNCIQRLQRAVSLRSHPE